MNIHLVINENERNSTFELALNFNDAVSEAFTSLENDSQLPSSTVLLDVIASYNYIVDVTAKNKAMGHGMIGVFNRKGEMVQPISSEVLESVAANFDGIGYERMESGIKFIQDIPEIFDYKYNHHAVISDAVLVIKDALDKCRLNDGFIGSLREDGKMFNILNTSLSDSIRHG